METLSGADLDLVKLRNGTVLPGLALPNSNLFAAFGDRVAPDGSGDVYQRWENHDDYLVSVVDALNTPDGAIFAKKGLGRIGVQFFSYRPEEPLYKAPCGVRRAANLKTTVVVVYSYGPK